VTWFLAGSSSFSWYGLAGSGDNHLATLALSEPHADSAEHVRLVGLQ